MPDETTRRCDIAGRPHAPSPGLLICDQHLQELGQLLRLIEDETLHLSSRPSQATDYSSSGGSAPAFQRSPARIDVIATRDRRHGRLRWASAEGDGSNQFDDTALDDTASVLDTLHAWAGQVRTERHLTRPTTTVVLHRWTAVPTGPTCWHPPLRPCTHPSCAAAGRPIDLAVTDTIPTPPGVTGERDLLTRNLTWIAQQPWVSDFHADLTALAAQLQRANQTADTPVGTCGTLQPNGSLCEGRVWHVLIRRDGRIARGNTAYAGPDDQPGFRCGTCRRVWTGTDAVRKRNDMWLDEQTRKATR